LELFIQPRALSLLSKVSDFLSERNIRAYLVGGFVRDVLLGRDTADIDIAVAADALEIAPGMAAELGGKYVLLDEANKVGRIVLPNQEVSATNDQWGIDLSTIVGGIEEDLARRDFTIDAMGVDLGQVEEEQADIELIDPSNGLVDLNQGVLQAVSPTAFESDAVRLLRAVRLAAELGFSVEKETEALIKHSSHLIVGVAGERVREELLRLLAISRTGYFLRYLDSLGLLTAIMPELVQARGVEQPKEHFCDVFDHSIGTVAAVDFLLRQGDWKYTDEKVLSVVPWSAELSQHFGEGVSSGSTRGSLLKLAALLHDIAKPETKTIEANGRMRFFGHAEEGAKGVVDILERLRFSNKEVRLVETMVRHHLRPVQMSSNGLPTRRAIYRYFRDTAEASIEILFLSLADHLAARGPNLDLKEWQKHAREVEYVLTQRFQEESLVVPPKLIDGHDLINVFGMSPGREIGKLLEAVHEAQAAGELSTKQQALSYVKDCLSVKGCK